MVMRKVGGGTDSPAGHRQAGVVERRVGGTVTSVVASVRCIAGVAGYGVSGHAGTPYRIWRGEGTPDSHDTVVPCLPGSAHSGLWCGISGRCVAVSCRDAADLSRCCGGRPSGRRRGPRRAGCVLVRCVGVRGRGGGGRRLARGGAVRRGAWGRRDAGVCCSCRRRCRTVRRRREPDPVARTP